MSDLLLTMPRLAWHLMSQVPPLVCVGLTVLMGLWALYDIEQDRRALRALPPPKPPRKPCSRCGEWHSYLLNDMDGRALCEHCYEGEPLYFMKAWHIGGQCEVAWTSWITPDMDGKDSGYDPRSLTRIRAALDDAGGAIVLNREPEADRTIQSLEDEASPISPEVAEGTCCVCKRTGPLFRHLAGRVFCKACWDITEEPPQRKQKGPFDYHGIW